MATTPIGSGSRARSGTHSPCAASVGAHSSTAFPKEVVGSWPRASATPANRIHLVYNAIHDDFFSSRPDRLRPREELGISADARLVVFVGRLVRDKGIGDLLDAAASVLLTRDAHLLLIGETPDIKFLREVRERLATESWGRRVRLLGPREDVPRLMMSSDVLVLPTLWEGFGLVLAEAMACGLPIVATNVGGIPEVLAGTRELMVPAGQPDALRHAVESVLDRHPEDAPVFAAAARASSARFTVDRRTAELYKLLTDVIRSEPRCLTLSFSKQEEPDHPYGGV